MYQRREEQRREEKRGARRCAVCLPACLPACELTMASAASSDEPVESDEKVCLDLFKAALLGKLDEVTRLLPLAKNKGVINKVMHGVHAERGREA